MLRTGDVVKSAGDDGFAGTAAVSAEKRMDCAGGDDRGGGVDKVLRGKFDHLRRRVGGW